MPRWSYGAPCTCSSVSGAFTVNTCYLLASGNLLHHMAQAQAPFSMESTWTYTRASTPPRKCLIVLLGILVKQTLLQATASVCFPLLTKCQGRCFWKSREQMGRPWHMDHCDISLELHLKLQIINLKFHFHDGGVSFGWKINAVMIISHCSPLNKFSNYHNKWFHHQFSVSWNLGKYEEQHLKRKRPSSSPAVCPH